MAAVVALGSLLRKLAARELREARSVGTNNFLLCILFLMAGSHRKQDAFWATALFQIFLVLPLLVAASMEAQERLPRVRRRLWPLTTLQQLALSTMSFALHPLLLVLLALWMGVAAALALAVLGAALHVFVFALAQMGWSSSPARLLPRLPGRYGAVVQVTMREIVETLDFWTALLLALAGSAYRLLGHPPADALPVLAIFVVLALSTVAQRLRSLDEGRAEVRYRLLPIRPWKLRLTQDAGYLALVTVLVLPLHSVAGITAALAALALGRYPAITKPAAQRRWRFTGGDLRFGALQVVAGGLLGLLGSRGSLAAVLTALALYGAAMLIEHAWLPRSRRKLA